MKDLEAGASSEAVKFGNDTTVFRMVILKALSKVDGNATQLQMTFSVSYISYWAKQF